MEGKKKKKKGRGMQSSMLSPSILCFNLPSPKGRRESRSAPWQNESSPVAGAVGEGTWSI